MPFFGKYQAIITSCLSETFPVWFKMDECRSKRQVAPRGGLKARSALAELAELRKSGARRADAYEIKEEEAVYDVVDEAQYSKLVQKRREEGGDQFDEFRKF